MTQPRISIVLPTCHRPQLCVQALTSLLRQTVPAYEIIIVDNGDNDQTHTAIRNLRADAPENVSITYIKEPRRGLVFARHTGAALSQADIVAFGDDDAVFEPNWAEEILRTFSEFPHCVAVGTRIEIRWDEPPPPFAIEYEGLLGKLDYSNERICRADLYVNGGSMAVRREKLYAVSGFNPGQLGDYLIGDSETGLCRKFHARGWQLAWTPFTTMFHLQFVKKHATFSGIRRRLWNAGIATAYSESQGGPRNHMLRECVTFLSEIPRFLVGGVVRRNLWHRIRILVLRGTECMATLVYRARFRNQFGSRPDVSPNEYALTPDYSVLTELEVIHL